MYFKIYSGGEQSGEERRKAPEAKVFMEIRVLGCYGGELPGYRPCSFLVDGKILVDAGTVCSVLSASQQCRITHILITHAHIDHIKDLPFLAANRVAGFSLELLHIMSIPAVIREIQAHLFNDTLWPDFSILPTADKPIIKFYSLEPGEDVELEGYTVKAIPVNHQVPAVGYIIRKGKSSILYSGDTGPTEMIWEEANQAPDLKAVLIENSFPNRERAVAERSGHLTPGMLRRELKKMKRSDIPIFLVHMKPQYLRELRTEVRGWNERKIAFMQQGARYRF